MLRRVTKLNSERRKDDSWPFRDPPEVAVFISKKILSGEEWIYCVTHDADDGAWQFHPASGFISEDDVSIVSLRTVYQLDPSIESLVDLPLGHMAWRETQRNSWEIQKNET
ncbi:MAG: hypothetical protein HKM05_10290 [Spirochaetales bacterium]|nr:hypothetical protein [Spirochaetales bacterium]